MAFHDRILSWALISILRLRFPPGKSMATIMAIERHRANWPILSIQATQEHCVCQNAQDRK